MNNKQVDKFEDRQFPYPVKGEYVHLQDGKCCSIVSDYSGFRSSRCKNKAKEEIEGVGLCGIHARVVRDWRK